MKQSDTRAFSIRFERAMRLAAEWHHGQDRKGGNTPYIVHPFGVALILDRHGFDEEVLIAGLLHDVVEDTEVSLDELTQEFGPRVAGLVADCSETKLDTFGEKRPWADRKRDHLAALVSAPVESRAVVLADKLHNLISMAADIDAGRPVWSLFHADRDQVLAYYRACLERLGEGESLAGLVAACAAVLADVERHGG